MNTQPSHIQSHRHAAPDSQGEALSALLDGELPAEEARDVLQHLNGDAAARARFAAYVAIGDTLRGQAVRESDFTAQVMAALQDEPTVLAPMRQQDTRRPLLWLAAAAVGALTWGLWQTLPNPDPAASMVAATTAQPVPVQSADVQAYLAAHQDFAQAVLAPAEMNFTRVSFVGGHP